MTTAELLKEYLQDFFVLHQPEKLLSLLTEDIHSYGFAGDHVVENLEQVRGVLLSGAYDRFMVYQLAFKEETEFPPDTAFISYTLSHEGVTVKCRLTATSRMTPAGRRLCLLHGSVVNPFQTPTMFADVRRERLERRSEGLLKSALPGGVMGGYIAPGFPFYCINENMLKYLGYSSEEEFVQDNNGLIENCMHPDDRARVNREVEQQLAAGGEYQIEYRMRKMDNSYIWVHDVGQMIRAENGRDAILSVCYDVSKQVQAQKQLADVIHNVPGGVCMYRWDGAQLTPVIVSEQAAHLFGITAGDAVAQMGRLRDSRVHPQDLAALQATIHRGLNDPGKEYSHTYRIWNAEKNAYRWVCSTGICLPQGDGTGVLYINYTDVSAAKELEQRLQKEEEMLQSACDFAHVWTWVYEISRDRIHCFRQLREDFGLPEYLEDYPNAWLARDFVQPQSAALYREKVLAIKNGSNAEEFETQIYDKDHAAHWVRTRLNRLTNDPDVAICTSQLIDNEKHMAARIELEEKQQASGGSNLRAHFIINATQGKLLERSFHTATYPELERLSTLEEQTAHTLPYIITEQKRAEFLQLRSPAWLLAQYEQGQTEASMDYRCLFPDGSIRWVRSVIHLLRDPRNGDVLDYEYVYDIHQQHISEEMTRAVVASGFELCASLMVDRDQVTILHPGDNFGATTLEITRYSPFNRAYADAKVIEEDRAAYLQASSLENISQQMQTADQFEFVHRTREDGVLHYKKDLCYAYSADHSLCLLVRSDVTNIVVQQQAKQVELQRALAEAEAATLAKSEFLSRMSHEIRTPMNAIMGMTAIAKDNRADAFQVGDCLDKIDLSSRFLLTLINDILEMSRIESGRTELKHAAFRFDDLIEGIRTVVEPLAQKGCLHYEFWNNAQTDPRYLGDATRIQQVLVNLISNAIKFTRAGGTVRFSVNIDSESAQRTNFRFVVADTGIGMGEAFMEKMFHPFTQEDSGNTSKYDGSGLGLAIAKSLVEMMGGKISAESRLGVGSTFTVELPLGRVCGAGQGAPDAMPQPAADFSVLRGCRVLMAEDHPLNVMVATKLLERKGVIVTVAPDGQSVVEQFKAAAPGHYAAVLMDIRMPVMDGLDAARAIRALDRPDAKTTPIIAMTANALEEDRQSSRAAGMSAHLAKPFEPAQLYAVLAEEIRKAATK